MANTTNFGWETPDDTDLVKDGALAMRTLGNAIDTSLVDLKGGTTGQVLSKNTNTDMDFVWTTPQTGDITAVTAGTGLSGGGTSGDVTLTNTVATTFDAKGDLVVGTGADTFVKLTVGTNGHTLLADSSTASGLKWAVDPVADIVTTAGDILYATGADTLTRLAIGTAGQVLKVNSGATAPEWGAAAAASGLTLIKTQTIGTGVTDVTVSDAFSSTYDNYKIVVAGGAGSGGEAINMQLGTTTSGYSNNAITMSFNSTTVTGLNWDNHSAWVAVGRFSTNIIHCDVDVYAPNLAKTTLMRANGSGSAAGASGINYIGFGFVNNTTQYTSFKLLSAGASSMTGGTIFVYGYAK